MSFNAKLIVIASILALLSGCGQRGPLYLPEPAPAEPAAEAATPATVPAATPADADEEDDAER